MRLIIIEDERPAANRLQKLLLEAEPATEVLDVIDTVEDAAAWFAGGQQLDLAFMDIQLADGLSFEIFKQVEVRVPVIFTTAFDQYALRAFKSNGIDYLLKPVDPIELRSALDKFKRMQAAPAPAPALDALMRMVQEARGPRRFRERFLIKQGEQLRYVPTADAAYFQADTGYVSLVTHDGQRLLLDQSLEQIAQELDPAAFFQISRQCIVSLRAIHKIHTWLNSRLRLDLTPPSKQEVVVSRDRVKDFKGWLDS
jgi:DNA-binding LytR/AlgR family response regulator